MQNNEHNPVYTHENVVNEEFIEFKKLRKIEEKYRQMILTCIKYGSDEDGKITKTKLAKLVYLADFIWYYLHLTPMSGMMYKKLKRGPVPDVYFRILEELEYDEIIACEPKGKSYLFSLIEKNILTDELTRDEEKLISKIGESWQGKTTQEIVEFTHNQLPWKICHHGEIIPYCLITQEEPEATYGNMQL